VIGGESSTIIEGLSGVPYVFRVAAVNPGGQGPYSAPSGSSTPESTSYIPLGAPARLLDPRPGFGTVDGQFAGAGKLGAGAILALDVAGRAGIPSSAETVVLNVTVTQPNGPGWITVFPCDADQPNASNLNFTTGLTIPNAVMAKLSFDGSACLFSSQTTHLIVDVAGYFSSGSAFTSLDAPARILDSRPGFGTADGIAQGIGLRGNQSTTVLQVGGRVGVPLAAKSVVLNVTVTEAAGGGWITVYPCGAPQPNASNLNYAPGQTIPNLVVAKLGTNGSVCLYAQGATHLIVDVTGYFELDDKLVPLPAPARVVDTRPGFGTVDALYAGTGRRPSTSTLDVLLRGRAGVPDAAHAVVLNVTVTDATAGGWVIVYPCGASPPNASNLNYAAGQTIPNAVVAKVGTNGKVCFFTQGATQLIVDVAGYIT